MLRHQQKDEEAGGEGLGVVCTRKRLWRDADGNIVTKRPRSTQRSSTSSGSGSAKRARRDASRADADEDAAHFRALREAQRSREEQHGPEGSETARDWAERGAPGPGTATDLAEGGFAAAFGR